MTRRWAMWRACRRGWQAAVTFALLIAMGMSPLGLRLARAVDSPTNADLIYNSANGEVWIDSGEAANQILTNCILKNDLFALPDFFPVPLFPEEVNAIYPRFSLSTSTLDEISWSDEQIFSPGSTWQSEIGIGAVYGMGAVFPTGLDDVQLDLFLTTRTYVGDLGTGIQDFDLVVVAGSEWSVDASGDWNTASNWLAPVVPNDTTRDVIFGDAISAPRTITNSSINTVRSITFSNANSYTIDGAGILWLEAAAGNASVVVSGGPVLAGAHRIQTTVVLNSQTDMAIGVDSLLSFDGILALADGLTKTDTGRVDFNGLVQASNNLIQADAGVVGGIGDIEGHLFVNGATLTSTIKATNNLTIDSITWSGGTFAVEAIEKRTLDLVDTSLGEPFGDYSITVATLGTVTGSPTTVQATSSEVDDNATRLASHIGFGNFVNSVNLSGGGLSASVRQAAPGDLDGDGLITINIPQPFPLPALPGDALILVPKIGVTSGAEWTDGDIDGDGAVTINLPQPFPLPALPGDALILLENLGGPGQLPIEPDAAAPGTAHMHYNPVTGEVTFSTGGGITDLFVNSVNAVKPAAGMISFGDGLVVNEPTDATWLSVGGFSVGDHYAGFVLQPGLTQFDGTSGDLVFFYNGNTLGEVIIDTPEVPEPSSIVLAVLAFAGLLAHGRRRRTRRLVT